MDIIPPKGVNYTNLNAFKTYAKKENGELQILHKTDNGNRPLYWDTLLKNVTKYIKGTRRIIRNF